MIEWLRGLFSLPHYKLLAFAVSIFAWLYVQGGETIEESYRVSLAWKMPQGLVTTEPLPASILATLRGSRSAMRRAEDADLMLAIDLSETTVGEAEPSFDEYKVTGLPPNVDLIDHSPSSLRFVVDESDTRKLKVRPEIVGDPGSGYAVSSIELDPTVVEVIGPRVVVEELRELATKPIDVSGMTGTARIEAEVALPRSVELAEGATSPMAIIEFKPTVERREVADVAVVIPRHADWMPERDTVSVVLEGPAGAIEQIAAGDLLAVVYLPDEVDRARYEASFGPSEGLRISVPLGVADVAVVATEPPSVEVRKR